MAASDRTGAAARRRRSETVRIPRPRSAAGTESHAPDLDRLIHERLRLGILSALATADALTFNELKAALRTTDGNLSVHARKLEDAAYVTCTKGFDGRRPRTEYRLTALGRKELARYLTHMEALIRATRDTMGR